MTMEKRRLFVIGTIGAGTVFGGPGGSETVSVTKYCSCVKYYFL